MNDRCYCSDLQGVLCGVCRDSNRAARALGWTPEDGWPADHTHVYAAGGFCVRCGEDRDDHDDRPRPCGCPVDYHLADCPIRVGASLSDSHDWDPYGDEL